MKTRPCKACNGTGSDCSRFPIQGCAACEGDGNIVVKPLSRQKLGERMLQWHSGQDDPVYAIGSFFVDSDRYPHPSVLTDAIWNLNFDLRKFRTMNRGEKVMVRRLGQDVSLKEFAGYTRKVIRENIADLREIVENLKYYQSIDLKYLGSE